jgi:hypothetical protein
LGGPPQDRVSHPLSIVLIIHIYFLLLYCLFTYLIVYFFCIYYAVIYFELSSIVFCFIRFILYYVFHNTSELFVTFDFLCVMCLIEHNSGVLYISYMCICLLYFYYGCQMAGLINVEYIYYTCVNCKMQHIALCYDYHTSLCASYNTTCTTILTDGTTQTTRPDGRCRVPRRVYVGKYTKWLPLHCPNDKRFVTYSKIFIFYITPIRVCWPIQDRSIDLFRTDLMVGTQPCAIAYASHFALGWARCSIALVMILNLINRLYDG